jgi:hypothetical protein
VCISLILQAKWQLKEMEYTYCWTTTLVQKCTFTRLYKPTLFRRWTRWNTNLNTALTQVKRSLIRVTWQS